MIVYRGDSSDNFEVKKTINSRYGFPAVFFTSNIEAARLFAKFLSEQNRKFTGGSIYKMEFHNYMFKHDFKSEVSHSAKFRNLIYQLHRDGHKAVLIENVYDYPSESFKSFDKSDILVIFDLDIIKKVELIHSNIK